MKTDSWIRTFARWLCVVLAGLAWACGSAIESSSDLAQTSHEAGDEIASTNVYNGYGIVDISADDENLLQFVNAQSPAAQGLAQLFSVTAAPYLAANAEITSDSTVGSPSANYNFNDNELSFIEQITKKTAGLYCNGVQSYPIIKPATVTATVPASTLTWGNIGAYAKENSVRFSVPSATNFTFALKIMADNTGCVAETIRVDSIVYNTTDAPNANPQNHFIKQAIKSNGRSGFPATHTVTGIGLNQIDSITVGGVAATIVGTPTATSLNFSFSSGCGAGAVPVLFKQAGVTKATQSFTCGEFPFLASRKPLGFDACIGCKVWFLIFKTTDFDGSNCPKVGSQPYFADYYLISDDESATTFLNYVNQSENSGNNSPAAFNGVAVMDTNKDNILNGTDFWCRDSLLNTPQPDKMIAFGGCAGNSYTNFNTQCSNPIPLNRTTGGIIFSTDIQGGPLKKF